MERLRSSVPHGHSKTTTFVAGLRLDGLAAPLVFDGPINASAFEAYVEPFLAPTLSASEIMVMDNLCSHKRPKVRELIAAVGATLLYLRSLQRRLQCDRKAPLQGEDLLRKTAERTVESLRRAVGACLDRFCPRECANYFEAARYEPT